MGPLEARGSGGVLGGGRRLLRGLEVLTAPRWGRGRCDSAVSWCGQDGDGGRPATRLCFQAFAVDRRLSPA